MHYVIHCAKKTVMYITTLHMWVSYIHHTHVYSWQSSDMVSYRLHPLPGCMHLFASAGQIKVVAPKQSMCRDIQHQMAPTKLVHKQRKIMKKIQLKCHCSTKNERNISVSCKKCYNTNTFKNGTYEIMIQTVIHSTSPLTKECVMNVTMLHL